MVQKILMKNEIGKFYIELAEDYNIFAPVNEKGNIVFKKILNSEDIILIRRSLQRKYYFLKRKYFLNIHLMEKI